MLQQDQTNISALKFFPPCLLNYVTTQCSATIQPNVPCTKGLGSNMSIINFQGVMHNTPCPKGVYHSFCLPNFYDQNSTLYCQGVLIGALQGVGFTNNDLLAMGLNSKVPFTVEITSFEYFNASGGLGNKQSPGAPPTTFGGEYYYATYVQFTYNFVVLGMNQSNVNEIVDKVTTNVLYYNGAIKQLYKTATVVQFQVKSDDVYFYAADPVITHKNGASSMFSSFPSLAVLAALVSVAVASLL